MACENSYRKRCSKKNNPAIALIQIPNIFCYLLRTALSKLSTQKMHMHSVLKSHH